jgi:hypothetical protein
MPLVGAEVADEVLLAAMRQVSDHPHSSWLISHSPPRNLTRMVLAYQEGYAGRHANRGTPIGNEDGDKASRNADRGTRGARGNRGPRRGGDRHSRTGIT